MHDLFQSVPVYPLTFDIARLAARIGGEAQRKGAAIPFQDLVIGVTALQFDYAVATLNVRHFQMIPGLVVKFLQLRPSRSQIGRRFEHGNSEHLATDWADRWLVDDGIKP